MNVDQIIYFMQHSANEEANPSRAEAYGFTAMRLQEQKERISVLEKEVAELAAFQCHGGRSDAGGNLRCKYQDEIAELKQQVSKFYNMGRGFLDAVLQTHPDQVSDVRVICRVKQKATELYPHIKGGMNMQLVILESPFAGGENIKVKAAPMLGCAKFTAVAAAGGFSAQVFRCATRTEAVKEAKRELAIGYARVAMRDCLERGEAPYASHLLYTQPGVLDDDLPDERALGIEAGLQWGAMAPKTVVYTDLGVSAGMRQGIERAKAQGRAVEYRSLTGWSNED